VNVPIVRNSTRRGFVAGLSITLLLAGCGDDEPKQRKAFIDFLQTRIVDKPGVHVPHLTDEQAKSFGDYAKQYAVITDFNAKLDASVGGPMQQALQNGMPSSLDDVVARRGDLAILRDDMTKLRETLQEQLAAADAAHVALKQPDDLKRVFDAAYAKDVTAPAQAFSDIFPDVIAAQDAALAVADFITQHRGVVKIQGSQIQVSDQRMRQQLSVLIDALRAKQQSIVAAQRRLRSVVMGQ
jgi:hypothetical protein